MDLEFKLKLEYVGYPNDTGGRVWIGEINVGEVYERITKGDLFVLPSHKYEFHLTKPFKKYQEKSWLEQHPQEVYIKTCDTIEEGLIWLKQKLIGCDRL